MVSSASFSVQMFLSFPNVLGIVCRLWFLQQKYENNLYSKESFVEWRWSWDRWKEFFQKVFCIKNRHIFLTNLLKLRSCKAVNSQMVSGNTCKSLSLRFKFSKVCWKSSTGNSQVLTNGFSAIPSYADLPVNCVRQSKIHMTSHYLWGGCISSFCVSNF